MRIQDVARLLHSALSEGWVGRIAIDVNRGSIMSADRLASRKVASRNALEAASATTEPYASDTRRPSEIPGDQAGLGAHRARRIHSPSGEPSLGD